MNDKKLEIWRRAVEIEANSSGQVFQTGEIKFFNVIRDGDENKSDEDVDENSETSNENTGNFGKKELSEFETRCIGRFGDLLIEDIMAMASRNNVKLSTGMLDILFSIME